jgi:hypothetical protein
VVFLFLLLFLIRVVGVVPLLGVGVVLLLLILLLVVLLLLLVVVVFVVVVVLLVVLLLLGVRFEVVSKITAATDGLF